jgi:UDP-glucose 4-epimerase
MKEPEKFYVETISVRGNTWKSFDFSKFDVVFHVAGIAHISPKKDMKDHYFSVNRDLTIEVAKKAKNEGVEHFIFMSSMIVYSSKESRITKYTIPKPDNSYGKSKLEAEDLLNKMCSKDFYVNIIRSPLIYGFRSRGNFGKFLKYSKFLLLFPKTNNLRSMIYIQNLCIIIGSIIDKKTEIIVIPSFQDVVSTSQLLKQIHHSLNKKTIFIPFPKYVVSIFTRLTIFNKIFSDFYYDLDFSHQITKIGKFEKISFEDSIFFSIHGEI